MAKKQFTDEDYEKFRKDIIQLIKGLDSFPAKLKNNWTKYLKSLSKDNLKLFIDIILKRREQVNKIDANQKAMDKELLTVLNDANKIAHKFRDKSEELKNNSNKNGK